jgi:pimeloyl-ACP methyl ester carboxylesterase
VKVSGRVLICAALAMVTACGSHRPAADRSAAAAAASAPTASVPVAAAQFTPSADGVSIAWHRYGQGETAVVLIHGWAMDSSIWRAQLPALTAHYSVVTVDLAGQGASGANRQSWTLVHFAQDVAAVVAQLPDARIVLVGDGLGGPVALEAAPLIGARLMGIIGVETFRTLGLSPPLPAKLDHELQSFRADFPGAVRQFVGGTLFHAQADPALVRFVAERMAQTPPDRALAALSELNKLDYATILPAVTVPIVVIDSDLDGTVDAARLQHAAARLRVVNLGGDDSFAMLDDAQRFNATLLQALGSLAAQ